jgi:outer membrane lipoprotein carrier protein
MLVHPERKRYPPAGRRIKPPLLGPPRTTCGTLSGRLFSRTLNGYVFFLLLFLALVLTPFGLPELRAADSSSDSTVGALVEAIDSRYRDVKTLKTEFTQTYVWGDTTKKESGTAYFARGGLMRWDYQQPKDKLVVADGKRMWLYIPQEKQVTQSPFKPQDDPRVPFPLLLSHFDLRKVFSKVEIANQALKAAPGNRVLRGYARRGSEDLYSQVLIEVTPSRDIKRLVVFYPDRSVMEFAFDHMQTNLTLSPALFTFAPPAGSEVIQQ